MFGYQHYSDVAIEKNTEYYKDLKWHTWGKIKKKNKKRKKEKKRKRGMKKEKRIEKERYKYNAYKLEQQERPRYIGG